MFLLPCRQEPTREHLIEAVLTESDENTNRLEPMLIRLPPAFAAELRNLARRTRVRQSDYLREAVADLLAKYGRSPTAGARCDRRRPVAPSRRLRSLAPVARLRLFASRSSRGRPGSISPPRLRPSLPGG